jgi:hypothetical protein
VIKFSWRPSHRVLLSGGLTTALIAAIVALIAMAASALAATPVVLSGLGTLPSYSTTQPSPTALPTPSATPSGTTSPTPSITRRPTPTATGTTSPKPTPPSSPKPTPTPTPTPTPAPTPTPTTGLDVWLVAGGGAGPFGSGSRGSVTYRVEVEEAANLEFGFEPETVANKVDATLAGARGWTNQGWRFTRTSGSAGLVVRVATRATVKRICQSGGLNMEQDVSCRVGQYVMLSATRWSIGSDGFWDDVPGYRTLLINHEVGHFLGHHHPAPGAGCGVDNLMKVMKSVFGRGLEGCTKNVWPYTEDGRAIDGPND